MERMTVNEYLQVLSSKSPVPGGGGTSALGGAMGMALGSMVGNLITGKKKYAAYETDIRRLIGEAEKLQEQLVHLMNEDAAVFQPVSDAYRLPKETEEQLAYREQVLETTLKGACLVPIEVIRKSLEGLDVLEELLVKGSVLAVSDVGVGAAFLRTAINGAVLNVYINTRMMKNRELASELNRETKELQEQGIVRADRLYQQVLEKLEN